MKIKSENCNYRPSLYRECLKNGGTTVVKKGGDWNAESRGTNGHRLGSNFDRKKIAGKERQNRSTKEQTCKNKNDRGEESSK